ncbi:MAG: fatty acid--CoA ligase, partial [Clostridia bacterium]|nr:fatty acid--CoA ligase [Clostridia bacterium]
ARIDEDGFIWITDRADDMIISGAENVYPREVEDVLYEHPQVVQVAVTGIPDEKWGKIVVAFVVPKAEGLTAEELDRFLLEGNKLAPFKRPRKYVFAKELPKTASGKIQKFRLQELLKD